MKRIKLLTNEIIYDVFPSLRKTKIRFIGVSATSFFMWVFKIPFCGYFILVDKECLLLTKNALSGLICHELAHIYNPWLSERETDKLVIALGYGSHLYEFMKFHDKHYVKYNKKDGLTKKEIKALI